MSSDIFICYTAFLQVLFGLVAGFCDMGLKIKTPVFYWVLGMAPFLLAILVRSLIT